MSKKLVGKKKKKLTGNMFYNVWGAVKLHCSQSKFSLGIWFQMFFFKEKLNEVKDAFNVATVG
jgi:hypothetical protein